MKAVFEGSISFGLVNIPVKLYSAIDQKDSKFRLLDSRTKTPVHYKRWCEKCTQEVPWKDVVKGLEIGKGQYLIMSKEELEKLRPEKTDRIEIVEFVDADTIDPAFTSSHYYLGPDKTGARAYFLLREVLQLTAKTAIGRFVMREREYICAISAYKEGMLLTVLHYQSEVRDVSEIEGLKERVRLNEQEVKLAKDLIGRLVSRELDLSKFKDTFVEELKKASQKRDKGELVTPEKPKPTAEKNLVEALKKSLKAK